MLLVGADGMLGSMVRAVAEASGRPVAATQRRDPRAPGYLDAAAPVEAIADAITDAGRRIGAVGAVINCVGLTRVDPESPASVEAAYLVNGVFPWKLGFAARLAGARVLHVSSDGVFRGRARPYTERSVPDAGDVYGLSKRAGEPALAEVLSVRTSIVGPAAGGQGLLEWLLRHPDGAEVPGYTNHRWTGATTLQLARFLLALADAATFDRLRAHGAAVHYCPNSAVTKYALLRAINAAYGRRIRVRPARAAMPLTRVLTTRFAGAPLPAGRGTITAALRELARSAPSTRENAR